MTTTSLCSIAHDHAPAYRTIELHHVIPVAWQLHTVTPLEQPSPGQDPDGRGHLWDSRGVWLCPTHHRNVHYWIVKLMHELADPSSLSNDPTVAWSLIGAQARRLNETQIAYEALTRYQPYGSFLDLIAAGEWGES